jgi:hypothetical protein
LGVVASNETGGISGCIIETSVLRSAAAHLPEVCDYLDIDGIVLIKDDLYDGIT